MSSDQDVQQKPKAVKVEFMAPVTFMAGNGMFFQLQITYYMITLDGEKDKR